MYRSQITFAKASTLNEGLRSRMRRYNSRVLSEIARAGEFGVVPRYPLSTKAIAGERES